MIVFSDGLNNFREEIVTSKKFTRVTIPPKIWFGFQGMSKKNLIINISNINHEKQEILRKKQKEIKFNWRTI
jgi:dTDP-4-dehydrorhamnose 3,5-epimerase